MPVWHISCAFLVLEYAFLEVPSFTARPPRGTPGPAPWQASRLHRLLLARQRTWPNGRHAAALTATLHDGRIASCSSNDQCAYSSPVVISPNRYSTWQARARLPSPLTAVSRSGAPAWPVILVRRVALRRSCNAFNCNHNAALYDVETIARAAPAARYIKVSPSTLRFRADLRSL